jgi:hypothetical protein
VRSEILTPVPLRIFLFWDVSLCCLVVFSYFFEEPVDFLFKVDEKFRSCEPGVPGKIYFVSCMERVGQSKLRPFI